MHCLGRAVCFLCKCNRPPPSAPSSHLKTFMLTHTHTHSRVCNSHTHTFPPAKWTNHPREPCMAFPQLNRSSFPSILSQHPRMMSFTKNQNPTLPPKNQGRKDLPTCGIAGNYNLCHHRVQGVKEPSEVWATPI